MIHDSDPQTRLTGELLALLREALALGPRVSDRRAIWLELAPVLLEFDGSVGAAREALDAGDFSARNYFSLGEVAAGVAAVRQALAQETPVPSGPYDMAPTVHLALPRLQCFAEGDARLGPDLTRRIEEHLRGCPACTDAAATLRLQSGDGA